jgi:chromosome segregation ATPase
VHSEDLQALRVESAATIEQLRTAQQSTIDELKAEHEAALDSQVKSLEKKLAGRDLELKATQDDLAKAKGSLAATAPEIESLKAQLQAASRDAESIAASVSADQAAEVERLVRELAAAKDDMSALTEALEVTKESMTQMSRIHGTELEENASKHVANLGELRTAHANELAVFASEKSALQAQLSDLQGELATLQAAMAAEQPLSKPNGTAAPASEASGDALKKLHEAHQLKMEDLRVEHERTEKALQEQLELALNKAADHELQVGNKAMEVQFLEHEQDELTDEVARSVSRSLSFLLFFLHLCRLKEYVTQLEKELGKN